MDRCWLAIAGLNSLLIVLLRLFDLDKVFERFLASTLGTEGAEGQEPARGAYITRVRSR